MANFRVITSVGRLRKAGLFAVHSSSSSSSMSLFLTRNTSMLYVPICTKSHDDSTAIASSIISIFNGQKFSPNDTELDTFAPKLTSKVVETVLGGLRSWRIAYMFFNWASNQHGYKHNSYTYNAMASVLSRARQNAPLKVLVMDVLNSGCSMSPGALGFFLRCLGSVGLVEEANTFFDQVRIMGLCNPNSYSYNCLLEVSSKSNSIELVEKRLKEMLDLGWKLDKYTLTPVLQVYCNAGNFDKALDVFNEIYSRGWADAHVYSILLLSFSKWGQVDKAFDMVERMETCSIRLNEKTFSVLIHGFAEESRIDRALQLFDKMRKSGFTPDVSLFDVLIGGLCKNNELDKAMGLYSEMKELGIHPDVRILTKLLSSVSEEVEMIRLLQESPPDMDAEAKVLLYNSVLNGLVNNGLIDQAYHLLLAMMGQKHVGDDEKDMLFGVKDTVCPNTASFSIVIDGLLKLGRLDDSLNLFHEMVKIGCKRNILLYNNLINGLCDSNRLEEGRELWRELKESGFKPTHFTHNSIYGCLCRTGDVSGALDLVREMRVHGHEPWIKHSTLLVKQLCKCGKAEEACNFLASMVQEGFQPDIIAYSAALYGLTKIQRLDKALELFQSICANGYCPDVVAHNILMNGLCKAGRISEAQEVLNSMLLKGLVPSAVTYNLLIDGWCKTGDVDRAVSCLSRMFGEQREPNVVSYTTLIDGFCNAKRPNDALMMWNEMREKGCVPNRIAFMALIHGLCKCDKPDTALIYLREMKDKEMELDTFVYVALISAFLSQENAAMAVETLIEMVDSINFPDPLDKNHLPVQDTILKLLQDPRTSSNIKNLIAEGRIPRCMLSTFMREP